MASKTNTLDWEEARAEFFQETFLPSESLNSNTSTALRRQNEAQSVGGGASASFRDASVGTLESHSSRMSNAHLNRSQASTTPADAISPQDDSPPSAQPPSVVGTSSRVNKSRHMRAAVQGLEEEEESDEEDSQDLDTSETYSIGGKTSYAAFMDRLDDVRNLSCLHYNYSEIISIDLGCSSNILQKYFF